MKPPIVSFRVSNTDIRFDTGELLFPTLVLGFCAIYYLDTRGLPNRSMMYAEPLLFATAILAAVTIFRQAISVARLSGQHESDHGSESAPFIGWGAEEEPPVDKQPTKESQSEGFGTSSAIGVTVLLAAYLVSLYVVPYVIGTAVFLGGTLYLLGERSIGRILIYSLGFTLLTWVVFAEWLFVPLP